MEKDKTSAKFGFLESKNLVEVLRRGDQSFVFVGASSLKN